MGQLAIVQTPDLVWATPNIHATQKATSGVTVFADEHIPAPGLFAPPALIILDHEGRSKKDLENITRHTTQWEKVLLVTTNMTKSLSPGATVINPPATIKEWGALLVTPDGFGMKLSKTTLTHLTEQYEDPLMLLTAALCLNATGMAEPYTPNPEHDYVIRILDHISGISGTAAPGSMEEIAGIIGGMPGSKVIPVATALSNFLHKVVLVLSKTGEAGFYHQKAARRVTNVALFCKTINQAPPPDEMTKPLLVAHLHMLQRCFT